MKIQKRIFLLFAVIAVSIANSFAQDVITKKNGETITGLVYEIGDIDVKYKKIENPNGPNYMVKKSEISMIKYANGSKDIFTDDIPPAPDPRNKPSAQSLVQYLLPRSGIDYRVKNIGNSLIFLKGQDKLNVVFDYSELIIQGFTENIFLETKDKDWVDRWEEAKQSSFFNHFLEYLNKNVEKQHLLCGDYPESQYQATVRVLTIKKKSEIECEVYFTKTDNITPIAKVSITDGSKNRKMDISSVERSFDYVGQTFGRFIAKQIQ